MRQQFVCNFTLILIISSVISLDSILSAPHHVTTSPRFARNDYALSEHEYQQLLDRLQREANDSSASGPRNYVDEDLPIDEVVKMIEGSSTTANPNAINDVSTHSLIRGQILSTEGVSGLTTKDKPSAENPLSPSRNYPRPERSEVSTMSAKADGTSEPECSICLEPIGFSSSETTPCRHKFHSNCLQTWNIVQQLQNLGKKCPLCRTPINHTH